MGLYGSGFRSSRTRWLIRFQRPTRSVGVRVKPVSEMLFSDRNTWVGFSTFGWRVSFVGWRRKGR